MQLSPATLARARQLGWSEDTIARIEASPLKDATVANITLMRIPDERVRAFLDLVDRDPERIPNVTFNFIRTRSERGVRAKPGPYGLTVADINIGTYGEVPDHWPYENDTPRGSHTSPENYAPGSYFIYDKAEVWAEGVDHLYEQAIRERWVPATDLDWDNGLAELPPELEKAVCQLATIYSGHALVEQKIIAKWLEPISYGFHDVKLFLGTQIYDAGHKVEALRKRALASGGGLQQAPLGALYRAWYGALKFSEMITALDVVYKSYELTLFEAAGDFAQSDLERTLFANLARDSRRHLEYGRRHLLWYIQHHPRGRENVRFWLGRAEAALSIELRFSHPEREALALLFARDIERIQAGIERLRKLREKQLADYIALLDEVGIDRLPQVSPHLLAIAQDPLAV
ncbi:hypothetical protein [Tepidiforma sp.]|uniref:hypothetical protein n=1 Tax=Tepidiforma sp. TaxID=2682230 RepID=UPI002ADDC21A|nr:hypothetical protein [Tepidiforma sp.]